MTHLQGLTDLFWTIAGLVRYHVPAEYLPTHTNWWAAAAIPVGLVLALWGMRLLRAVYVILFMIAFASVGMAIAQGSEFLGFSIAQEHRVDRLFGLFIGAGVGALVAYLLFRWWVGLSAAACAMLVVVVAGAPQINSTFWSAVSAVKDARSGVGTGVFTLPDQAETAPTDTAAYLNDVRVYVIEHHRDLVYKSAALLGLAGLLGLGIGILMPRLTMITGTSLAGTFALAAGISVLLSSLWPAMWAIATANPLWSLGSTAVFLLGSMLYQSRRKPVVVPPPAATPAAA